MDRISELPDVIVHHILTFLDTSQRYPAELVRMSVLSKTWFDLIASYPVLCFSNYRFRSRESFFKYVDSTTSKFCNQNTSAQRLSIFTTLFETTEVDIVNRCLELVLKNGVRELEIIISNSFWPMYRLPNVLLHASELKSLNIRTCELPSSLMLDVVQFKSLIHLNLHSVPIDDEVIKSLTTTCPLLQVFEISMCHGFKRFCVFKHKNLQKVDIHYNTQLELIDIEAPNLYDLSIRTGYSRLPPPLLHLASCKKLTTVYYSAATLPHDFLSNFPFIEKLHLDAKCSNLKWASHSLRTLVLESVCDLKYIELSTPNLVLFMYGSNNNSYQLKMACWTLLRDLTHFKGCMHFYANTYRDALSFEKFRRFLDIKNGFKVLNLFIHASYFQISVELEELKAIELPPYKLDHLEIQLDTSEESSMARYIAFVDAVLWCCRPRSLTLRSSSPSIDFDVQSDLVKFTYEKLLQQEDRVHTEIQIVSPSSAEAQERLMHLKSSSMALPRARKTISFIRKAVLQEEAG